MTGNGKKYVVIGSLNMDLVTRVARFPAPGETVRGLSFSINPGGKGGNQAVALGRLGCAVEMLGAIGDDALGAPYLETLIRSGVDVRQVAVLRGESTGTASILVDSMGENQISIVGSANSRLGVEEVERWGESAGRVDYLLMQLEVPLETVGAALDWADRRRIPVILDPAPAQSVPNSWFSKIAVLTPNETEAATLTGCDTATEAGIAEAGRVLHSWGVKLVIIKAGKRGAYWIRENGPLLVPGFTVATVDTVAAGDSFNAGLACALGDGMPTYEAIRFANAVAALSTMQAGAQGGMPTRDQTLSLLSE